MAGFLINLPFYIMPYLLVVGVVVTVHEFGHFLAAKAVRTRIDQFSLGFGRAWASWVDKSGVEWRLGLIPIGGYVRFAGDENAASVPDQNDLAAMRREVVMREGEAALNGYYHFKPIWQRAFISAAGPAANFLLAIVIFAALLMTVGEPISPARVGAVVPGGPAALAGFKPGDLILKADGKTIKYDLEVRELIILRSGLPTNFVVERGGRELLLTATPKRGPVEDGVGRIQQLGRLELIFTERPQDRIFKRYGPIDALEGGVGQARDLVTTTVFYLGRMISGHETADQLSGPVGMAQISGDLARQTFDMSKDVSTLVRNALIILITLIANISVGIGFLNLLPIPVLDGGHLLFYAYEAVARRPLAAKVQAAGYRVGLALVLGLMLFATWNDLQRLRVFNFIGGLFS
ncbi:MAG TPA: M50 family metallopeptidase [Phenylobacterium sp.]|uniref:M50 family metallopeptidase n=1 Tax=Phenylobacterium sp. TaxID=1871053 RepID=UPI002D2E3875|nr:M50 family metallopeptidase [Phenylobacterium sp.]HZZ68981.1 M50 family metallopeptidase [Phenylobacterium sp.]